VSAPKGGGSVENRPSLLIVAKGHLAALAFWFRHDPGLARALESEALAVDADDDRMMQDAIEHRHLAGP